MKIAIVADDTCDLPKEVIEANNIFINYIPNILGETEYRGNLTSDMIYDYVAKTGVLPQTAAASSVIYKEFFEKILESHDAIIHFSLSSGLSSSYQNAITAAKDLENVFIIDTKSLSSGSGLLVLSGCEKVNQGLPIEEIVQQLNEEVKHIQASFIISKLDYLKKGGRCSSVAVFGANLLGLKIMIELLDGKMVATKKYMGKIDATLTKYLKDLIAAYPPDMSKVFVTSSSKMPGVREKLVQEVKSLGFKEVYVTDAGSTICTHCGPGTIGVLYKKKS